MKDNDNTTCRLINLPKITDPRGALTFVESNNHIPFAISRVYYIYELTEDAHRAGHAHKQLHQLLIPVTGSFDVIIDDGIQRTTHHMNQANIGIYIPPMLWREIIRPSNGAVCLALASDPYEESDYYRDYQEFLRVTRQE